MYYNHIITKIVFVKRKFQFFAVFYSPNDIFGYRYSFVSLVKITANTIKTKNSTKRAAVQPNKAYTTASNNSAIFRPELSAPAFFSLMGLYCTTFHNRFLPAPAHWPELLLPLPSAFSP